MTAIVLRHSSKPIASDTTAGKGAPDKSTKTPNRNLAPGEQTDAVRTATSYFDPVWNAFSQHTDGSMKWIPKQIVAIGEDFHSQVGDDKVWTTLEKKCLALGKMSPGIFPHVSGREERKMGGLAPGLGPVTG